MIQKDTKGKPRLSLLPRLGLLGAVRAREYGIEKYGCDGGWANVEPQDLIDAAMRHLIKYSDGLRGYVGGSLNDEESGLSHMDHAAASVLLAATILESRKILKEVNDRQYAESDWANAKKTQEFFNRLKAAKRANELEELEEMAGMATVCESYDDDFPVNHEEWRTL